MLNLMHAHELSGSQGGDGTTTHDIFSCWHFAWKLQMSEISYLRSYVDMPTCAYTRSLYTQHSNLCSVTANLAVSQVWNIREKRDRRSHPEAGALRLRASHPRRPGNLSLAGNEARVSRQLNLCLDQMHMKLRQAPHLPGSSLCLISQVSLGISWVTEC